MCHNCNASTTFSKFLEHIDSEQHKQYVIERFANGDSKYSPYQKPDMKTVFTGPKPSHKLKNIDSIAHMDNCIAKLPDGHYAKEYIRARKIPQKYWGELLFTENYKAWIDETFPGHEKENLPEDARIVLFYTNESGIITNVSGRALADTKLRYVTVKILDEKKVFGMHTIDFSKRIYVVEGQFDSMFLPNAVACGDSNLVGMGKYLCDIDKNGDCEIVLVFDNTPRNKDIVKQMHRAIENEFQIVMLPYDPDAKDINEMIKSGHTVEEVLTVFTDSTFRGLNAQLKLNEWRKC